MLKRIIALFLALILTVGFAFGVVFSGKEFLTKQEKDSEEEDIVVDPDYIDPMVIEVTENFINAFWDAEAKYFFHNNTKDRDGIHFAGPFAGVYTDFWLEAQNWETVMDIYDRQGGSFYKKMIDDVYTGFTEYFPFYQTNKFNDDIGWWAMGCTRAYQITQNKYYLMDAKEMFDHIYQSYDENLGGGIYWTTDRKQKNICTNAPAVTTAARLSVLLDDDSYLQKAIDIFEWIKDNMYDEETGRLIDTINIDGSIYAGQHTYNYGTFATAAYELYLATNDNYYLGFVIKPLDYLLSIKTTDGILNSEGGGDGSAFRTIYVRALNMAKVLKPQYQEVINKNALATYQNRRSTDNLNSHDWTKPPKADDIIMSTLVATSVSLMQFYRA